MRFLTKDEMARWVSKLASDRLVVAPKAMGELVLFQPVRRAEEVAWDYRLSVLSPKEWLFPPTEVLFTLEERDGAAQLTPGAVGQEMVLFALRPCDAQGIALLDLPVLASPADSLYAGRRAKTALVGLACRQPGRACFCTSLGGGPSDATHVDLMLREVEEGYLVEVVTEKGQGLLPGVSTQEWEGDVLSSSKGEVMAPSAVASVPTQGLVEAMPALFNAPYWERLADRCLHCNICAYVCPTCYCFDVKDYPGRGKMERVRCWDSCQAPGFTRIAGGYTPRPTKATRL
ncbi:MAG: 4Fe-4S dicluster domain-containing protein, partial [Chloroflexota bacterium]|nr:4Fe-4S dicluster domain-containing protein [Chloroflexota bacterium]